MGEIAQLLNLQTWVMSRRVICSQDPKVMGQATIQIGHWGSRCAPLLHPRRRRKHQGPSIMGFENNVERSLGRPCRSSAGPSGRTNSPHPSSREGHHCHRLVEFELPPMTFDLSRLSSCCGRLSVQRNSVPSTQMRCMITAGRRANASARGAWSSLP